MKALGDDDSDLGDEVEDHETGEVRAVPLPHDILVLKARDKVKRWETSKRGQAQQQGGVGGGASSGRCSGGLCRTRCGR